MSFGGFNKIIHKTNVPINLVYHIVAAGEKPAAIFFAILQEHRNINFLKPLYL